MNFFCQQCKAEISLDKTACGNCLSPYIYAEGFMDYIPKDTRYWGELEENDMRNLLTKARQEGYRKACFEHFKNHKRRSLFQYILSKQDRIAFINFIYSKNRAERCLDLGSGFGTIPAGLSPLFKEVYSIENIRERVSFQTIIKEQDKIKNWHIIKGDIRSLPFPDNHFDFVSVNGVLEWVAAGDAEGSPREIQVNFLREIRRVLKASGVCYIGIENRFNRDYFRGALDHSGLPYTSLMPRFLADKVCAFKNKQNLFFTRNNINKKSGQANYRTYTYSKLGYGKLLREAGLSNMRIFHTGFSYNTAYAGIDDSYVSSVPKRRNIIKNKLTQFKYAYTKTLARLWSFFTPNFLMYCGKSLNPIQSDIEIELRKKFNENGPVLISKGFNNLTVYSLNRDEFYKTESLATLDTITPEKRVIGIHPAVIDENTFRRVVSELKKTYYQKPFSDIKQMEKNVALLRQTALSYDLPSEKTESYLNSLNQFYNLPLFARNHGDVWAENIFITPSGSIAFIDEEKEPFGLIPVEINRFILSIVGYDKFDSKEYKTYATVASEILGENFSLKILRSFALFALFAELTRRDYNIGTPRAELYLFQGLLSKNLATLEF